MCNDIVESPFDTLALSMLSYCFFEMPQSPFFQEFLQSGIAVKYCPGYGYDVTNKISTFTIGFSEISDNYNELMEFNYKIMSVLKSVSEHGLE